MAGIDDTIIVGTKEKAKNGYGQNGYQGASSLLPGETKSPIADVSPPQVAVPGLLPADTLAHRVRMDGDKAAEYTPHPSMSHRSVSAGSPGGKIPAAPIRRDSGKSLSPSTLGRKTH